LQGDEENEWQNKRAREACERHPFHSSHALRPPRPSI
jgi:hypothetical protein